MAKENRKLTCCFFGHRKISGVDELNEKLYKIIEDLIIYKYVDTFLFGSKSDFDKLCLSVVTKLKSKHPHIQRIYVRAEFQYITDAYKTYLLQSYEDTYYPEQISSSGRASYVERNQIMINQSDYCIFYYDKNYLPPRRKKNRKDFADYQPNSGTKIAYDYAVKKKRAIINLS